MNTYYLIVSIIVGLAVGSFLNVVVYRLPRGISIVRPRSSCPICGRRISWFENIPVASFLFLRGRCSGCGAPISIRYPLVEGLGAALAGLCFLSFGLTLDSVFGYAFLMALLAVALIDWEFRIIPDVISIPFLAAALVWSILSERLTLSSSVWGAVVGGGSLLVVGFAYRFIRGQEGMGGGDVKLMAMIGAALGIKLVLPVILLASLGGSLYGVMLLKSGKGARTAVAFGSFLASAAGVCLFLGDRILAFYACAF